jgi:hypothetical protein
MATAAYNLQRNAFIILRNQFPAQITHNGKTRTGTISGIESKRRQELAGLLPEAASSATLLQEDFTALAITDRSVIQVAGINLQVLAISVDPTDPTVSIVCKAAHSTNERSIPNE